VRGLGQPRFNPHTSDADSARPQWQRQTAPAGNTSHDGAAWRHHLTPATTAPG